ncbi:uroporphyrinogen decarboxylase [Gonapodya prolifera JEL478]|uniref:Uroporphyrinogen decarboxylase n=1 Tax=Gonapodya prolifera (strain JEL478) TaxID=1344416 RepID=A0A139ACY2_GONPJ|nr:uroporphyrinogen decarboxylase [Gonapodya prolifera JEL478]|eukprot:KXS14637.1 uroporphyrinogen decarboxylase [Gonapodya prolifera JEL478]
MSKFPPLKNDRLLRAVRGEPVDKVPVWIMRQAGRYLPEFRESRSKNDFFTICRTPSLACEVTLQPIDRYDGLLDASIIFSDILVVPQAMGMVVEMLPKEGPHFPSPLTNPADIAKLKSEVDVSAELGYVFDAITLTREKLGGRVPLFGFAGAPWTLFSYMIEGGGSKTFAKSKAWLFKWPKESEELLKRITDVVVDFLVGQAKAGAQILQVFDSNAGELSPSDYRQFILPHTLSIPTRVNTALRSQNLGHVPIVAFPRNAHGALKEFASSDYDAISIDFGVEPEVARSLLPGKTLQGNIDPSVLYGSKDYIRERVQALVAQFGTKKWIANLGHGVYPDHDPEHVRYFLEAIRDFTQTA